MSQVEFGFSEKTIELADLPQVESLNTSATTTWGAATRWTTTTTSEATSTSTAEDITNDVLMISFCSLSTKGKIKLTSRGPDLKNAE